MIMDIASTYVQYALAGYSDSFLANVWGGEYAVELCQMQMYRSLDMHIPALSSPIFVTGFMKPIANHIYVLESILTPLAIIIRNWPAMDSSTISIRTNHVCMPYM